MSEVKGALLGIILAIGMFTIVFGIIQYAMNNAATTVSQKMEDAAGVDGEFTLPEQSEGDGNGDVVVILP